MREWGEALWTARDLLPTSRPDVEAPFEKLEWVESARPDAGILEPHRVQVDAAPREHATIVPIRRHELWIATTKGFAAGALATGLLIVSTFWNAADRPVLVDDVAAQPPARVEGASVEERRIARQEVRQVLQRASLGSTGRNVRLAGACSPSDDHSPRAPVASVSTGVGSIWCKTSGRDGATGG